MPRSANTSTTHLHRCGVNCHSNRSASESAFGGEGRLRPSTPTRTISTPEMWQISERLILCRMKKTPKHLSQVGHDVGGPSPISNVLDSRFCVDSDLNAFVG